MVNNIYLENYIKITPITLLKCTFQIIIHFNNEAKTIFTEKKNSKKKT